MSEEQYSRNLSRPTKDKRRYYREDIKGLKRVRKYRSDPSKVTKGALNLGLPILESKITLIANGGLYYRGHDAVRLATISSVEAVAALIWLEKLDGNGLFDKAEIMSDKITSVQKSNSGKLP